MHLAVKYLIEASAKLECSVAVRIRALVLYHHFMRCCSQRSASGHNDIMVAAAALECAARYEEENIDYDSIVLVFYCIVNETIEVLHPRSPEYAALKKSLITVDNIMQRKLEYIFSHRLAHQFLVPFLSFILERNYKLAPYHLRLSQTAIRFANDSYTDPLCLNFKPDHIAIASIHASLHVNGFLKDVDLLEPWFQAFSRDLTVSKLKEIKLFMFRLYNGDDETPKEQETDQNNDCEIVVEVVEKETVEVEELKDVEVISELEIDKQIQKDGEKKQDRGNKRRQGKLSKRKHEESSQRKHKGENKRKLEEKASKEDGRDKEKIGGDKNKLDESKEGKHKETEERTPEVENKKQRKERDEQKPEEENNKQQQEGIEQTPEEEKKKHKEGIEEKPENENKKQRESDEKEFEERDKKCDKENEKLLEGIVKKSEKELDKECKNIPEEGCGEKQNPDAQDKDSPTIDMQLSAWTARFMAARYFDSSRKISEKRKTRK